MKTSLLIIAFFVVVIYLTVRVEIETNNQYVNDLLGLPLTFYLKDYLSSVKTNPNFPIKINFKL
jgi:hypothetical protein